MIDYGAFHFATARGTDSEWFMLAAGIAGLNSSNGSDPFGMQPRAIFGDPLRVSLVCHPCVWLRWSWSWGDIRKVNSSLDELDRSGTLDEFVWKYLSSSKGEIGRMMLSYDADSYIRVEDLPDAFVELMGSIGRPVNKNRLPPSPRKTYLLTSWNSRMKSLVMDAEKELVSHFDYF
jgi:hypothetical protein